MKWYEDLAAIAEKYGVSERMIMLANGLEDNRIRNNQVLLIPDADATEEDFAKAENEEGMAQATDSTEVDEWSAYASKRVEGDRLRKQPKQYGLLQRRAPGNERDYRQGHRHAPECI